MHTSKRWWRLVIVVLALSAIFPMNALADQPGGNSSLSYQTVFPPDERVQITDTSSFPASAIVFLRIEDSAGNEAHCSGTLIGPQVVLTAGHCLYNDQFAGGHSASIQVIPGRNGNLAPFGEVDATEIWAPDAWKLTEDDSWDVGLIKLQHAVGDFLGWFTIGVLTDDSLKDPYFKPVIGGYPGDKPVGTMWASAKEAFLSVEPHSMKTDLDLTPGESGSAVWRGSDGVIVGIITDETPAWNIVNRIDLEFLNELKAGCAVMRCDFEYYVEPPSVDQIVDTWARTDAPVAAKDVNRTWMWGPAPFTETMPEHYDEADGGHRTVVYFDKSRMEVTHPDSDPNSIWYVTNGLLSEEMITGNIQVGDNDFVPYTPAQVNVAGDPDDTLGPTYATFKPLLGATPIHAGWKVTQTLDRAGHVGNRDDLGQFGVTAAILVPQTNHTVASVFWDFMNSSGLVYENGKEVQDHLFANPFYATGYPITESYWSQVKVGGIVKDVLMQCFERRCLTYTPSNPDGWKVEAGNVGQHYYRWRYGE